MVPAAQTVRHLSLHEHYSMDFLRKYGVNVPKGSVAYTPKEAEAVAEKLGLGLAHTAFFPGFL